MNFSKISPLMNRVVVKRLKAPQSTVGGILLPDKLNSSLKVGLITEVGPGKINSKGVHINTTLQPGDWVLLPDYGGVKVPKIQNSDEELTIFQEDDILGIVENKNL
jgi:chaperonin GroES